MPDGSEFWGGLAVLSPIGIAWAIVLTYELWCEWLQNWW